MASLDTTSSDQRNSPPPRYHPPLPHSQSPPGPYVGSNVYPIKTPGRLLTSVFVDVAMRHTGVALLDSPANMWGLSSPLNTGDIWNLLLIARNEQNCAALVRASSFKSCLWFRNLVKVVASTKINQTKQWIFTI